MNIDGEGFEGLEEYIALAKEFKPVAGAIVDIIKSYGPELKDLAESICDGAVDLKIRAIQRYVDSGIFTKEEAMLLVMDSALAIQRIMSGANSRTSK